MAGRAAGRADLHRRAGRLPQSPLRSRTPAHRHPPQPLPGVDRRRHPRRHARLDQSRRPGGRRGAGVPGRGAHAHRERRVQRDVHRGRRRGSGRWRRRRAPGHRGGPVRRTAPLPAGPRRPLRRRSGPYRGRLRRRRGPHPHRLRLLPLGPCRPQRRPARRRPHPRRRRLRRLGLPGRFRRPRHRLQRCHGRFDRRTARRSPRRSARPLDRPLKNRLATSVAAFDGIGFDTLAQLTHQEALRP